MMVELTRKKVIVKVAHSSTQSPARAACDEAPPPTPPIASRPHYTGALCALYCPFPGFRVWTGPGNGTSIVYTCAKSHPNA